MQMEKLNKLLLTELRVLRAGEVSKDPVNMDFQSALAENENLKALGYELSPAGLLKLAQELAENTEFKSLYERVLELEPGITALPMYPNFPIQVLEMDEYELRVNQLIHYTTTYGVEEEFGIAVKRGWLPETEYIEARESDVQVADLKMLDYLSDSEIDEFVVNNLIGRKERLEEKELEIAKAVVKRTNLPIENIPFKENIASLFGETILNGNDLERANTFSTLSDVFKHPGDVLDFVEELIVLNKYKHFKTSVKRSFVNLIEGFATQAIEENLADDRWSNKFLGKKGTRRSVNKNISVIDYLSYNRFSKDAEAKAVVADLKSGKLFSWNQRLEQLYSIYDYAGVMSMLIQRPGIYFRQINRLVKNGVSARVIATQLKPEAGNLKTQSIVSALNNFEGDAEVDKVFMSLLKANLDEKELPELRGKKVFIDDHNVDFGLSKIELSDKFSEGGYISNGMAVRIPEKAKFLRFFTYWNDEKRIDIDLHGSSIDKSGRESRVGWNSRHKDASLVHSGDITHSNAAEYIDLDLTKAANEDIERVQFNLNSYTGIQFANIETVFTGLMALSSMGETVDLHDPKNTIFRHDLNHKSMSVDYGMIDLVNRVMYVGGKNSDRHNDSNLFELPSNKLTISLYLNILSAAQDIEYVDNEEDADIIFGLAKDDRENYISLIDENFFM